MGADGQGQGCNNNYGYGIVKAKAAYDLLAAEGCEAGGPATADGSQSSLSKGGCGQAEFGQPTPSPTPCQGKEMTLELTTDNYGSETSWDVKNSDGDTLGSGSGYSSGTQYTEEVCINEFNGECLTFTIKDSYGDGICCSYGQGSYEVFFDGDSVKSGGEFGSSESTDFACNEPAPTAPAPTVPAPTVPAPTEPAPTVPAPTVPAPTVPSPTEDTDFPSSIIPTESTGVPTPTDGVDTGFPSSISPTVSTSVPTPTDDVDTDFPSSISPTVSTDPPAVEVTDEPTAVPTDEPTAVPSDEPSAVPSAVPSDEPSAVPSAV